MSLMQFGDLTSGAAQTNSPETSELVRHQMAIFVIAIHGNSMKLRDIRFRRGGISEAEANETAK